jgi:hypothetical protein
VSDVTMCDGLVAKALGTLSSQNHKAFATTPPRRSPSSAIPVSPPHAVQASHRGRDHDQLLQLEG